MARIEWSDVDLQGLSVAQVIALDRGHIILDPDYHNADAAKWKRYGLRFIAVAAVFFVDVFWSDLVFIFPCCAAGVASSYCLLKYTDASFWARLLKRKLSSNA